MKMTDVRVIGFENAQNYIEFRLEQWLRHHTYVDLHYFIRFEAGHSATGRETFSCFGRFSGLANPKSS